MKTIRYKGKGEHSVRELETIIEQQAEQIHLFNSGETFESWHETHFEIVQWITLMADQEGNFVSELAESQGTGGLYELAKDLTDKFETLYSGVEWGIDEDTQYFDIIEDFLDGELK